MADVAKAERDRLIAICEDWYSAVDYPDSLVLDRLLAAFVDPDAAKELAEAADENRARWKREDAERKAARGARRG